MRELVRALQHDRSGAAAIEYGMLVALLSLAITAAMGGAGTAIGNTLQSMSDFLSSLGPSG